MADDFRSDTVTMPSAAMRRAMAEAEVGDDVYGEDPTVNRLEAAAAELLGMPRAVYVPTATMANQLAILAHTERGDEMFCDQDAHIYYYEAGAPAFLAGVMCHLLPHEAGVINPQHFRDAIRPANIHHPRPRLLSLENTHNRAGGSAVSHDAMAPLIELAHDRAMVVHLDGSRLFNAAVALETSPASLVGGVDSVTLCLSKGLGAPLGSLLVGGDAFIDRARRYRKQLGGGMRQAGIVAAAGLYGLTHHINDLAADHRRAAAIAEAIGGLEGFSVARPPHATNMVMVDVAGPAEPLVERARQEGLWLGQMGPSRIRVVTHRDVDDQAVRHLVTFFQGESSRFAGHGPV